MKWIFPGNGEIELPGPMYRNLVCPLATRRMPGGGDFLPGQDLDLINISKDEVECVTYGLGWPGESETVAITVLLRPKTELTARVLGTYWLVRITSWDGNPKGNKRLRDGWTPDAQRQRESVRRPAIRVTSQPAQGTNPLDASKVQRKLLE